MRKITNSDWYPRETLSRSIRGYVEEEIGPRMDVKCNRAMSEPRDPSSNPYLTQRWFEMAVDLWITSFDDFIQPTARSSSRQMGMISRLVMVCMYAISDLHPACRTLGKTCRNGMVTVLSNWKVWWYYGVGFDQRNQWQCRRLAPWSVVRAPPVCRVWHIQLAFQRHLFRVAAAASDWTATPNRRLCQRVLRTGYQDHPSQIEASSPHLSLLIMKENLAPVDAWLGKCGRRTRPSMVERGRHWKHFKAHSLRHSLVWLREAEKDSPLNLEYIMTASPPTHSISTIINTTTHLHRSSNPPQLSRHLHSTWPKY